MATVDKNFRIKNGLVVEGSVATVNGNNILTENTQAGDSYILNLVGGATLVKAVDTGTFTVDANGNLTINSGVFDSYGSASTAESNAAQDATNKANQALSDAQNYANGLASNYDAAGSASAAQTAAQNYADGLAGNYDAAGAATSAENAAKFYADGLISDLGGSGTASVAGNIDILTGTGIQVNGGNNSVEIDRQTVDTWYDAAGAASTAEQNANLYTDNAVSDLVGTAPQMLDTLQELATALQDNPDIITNLQDVAAGKQDTLTAGSNIDITGSTISVTGLDSTDISDFGGAARASIYQGVGIGYNQATGFIDANTGTGLEINGSNQIAIDRVVVDGWYDASGAAASAQSAAESYADTAATGARSDANTYTDNSINDVLDGTAQFTEVSIGWMTDHVAAYSFANSDAQVTAYSWNKGKGASAKFLVRVRNGIHSQVSEILLTKDNSDNIAITEYGIVTTNGILGDITADINGSNIDLKVTPTHADGTEIIISGTLMNYGD